MRLLHPAQGKQGVAEIALGAGEVRLQAQRLLKARDGFLDIPLVKMGHAQVRVQGSFTGPERDGAPEQFDRFAGPALQ